MNKPPGNPADRHIKNYSPDSLAPILADMGFEKFRLDQILSWLYNKGVTSWEDMRNVGKSQRKALAQRFELGILTPESVQKSKDGTRKYLFKLDDSSKVESVLIPDGKRKTLCISSQVGCALGCKFCHTGTMGLKRNLEQWEIIEQILAVTRERPASQAPTNVVLMGMGEPLMNYDNVVGAVELMVLDRGMAFSHRHITLSTAGIPKMIDRLAEDEVPLSIAISLNAADDELRSRIMPVNVKYPLSEVLAAIERYPFSNRRRVTFEYIMFRGVNDDELNARKLANRVKRFPCKINLIPFNGFPGCEFEASDPEAVEKFAAVLRDKHLSVFVRKSRGADIMAACCQLAAKE